MEGESSRRQQDKQQSWRTVRETEAWAVDQAVAGRAKDNDSFVRVHLRSNRASQGTVVSSCEDGASSSVLPVTQTPDSCLCCLDGSELGLAIVSHPPLNTHS